MKIPNEIFRHAIPSEIYQKINGDRGIGEQMDPNKMGMCMELISDYLSQEPNPTKKGWEDYYFSVQPKEPLIEAANYLINELGIDQTNAKRYVYFRIIGQTRTSRTKFIGSLITYWTDMLTSTMFSSCVNIVSRNCADRT